MSVWSDDMAASGLLYKSFVYAASVTLKYLNAIFVLFLTISLYGGIFTHYYVSVILITHIATSHNDFIDSKNIWNKTATEGYGPYG